MKKFLFCFTVICAALMIASLAAVPTSANAASSGNANHTVTSVHFKSIEKGIPQTIDLYHFTAKGRMWTQSIGKTRHNAGLVCPKNGKYSLAWNEEDGRVINVLPAGQCLRTQGQIEVSVLRGR
jgi:hypothetical protein